MPCIQGRPQKFQQNLKIKLRKLCCLADQTATSPSGNWIAKRELSRLHFVFDWRVPNVLEEEIKA
jgi:hypothetical protein